MPFRRKSQAPPSKVDARSRVLASSPLKVNSPLGSAAEPTRLISVLPLASLPSIKSAVNSWVLEPACMDSPAPMVTNGPTRAGAPLGCFNAAGAASVTENMGEVILMVPGKPGTFKSGRATVRSRSFRRSAFFAALLKVDLLMEPTRGITVSVTPPEPIKVPIPLEPLISRSANRLNPALKTKSFFLGSWVAASANTLLKFLAIRLGKAGSSGLMPAPLGGTTTNVRSLMLTPSSGEPAAGGTKSVKASLLKVTAITALSSLSGWKAAISPGILFAPNSKSATKLSLVTTTLIRATSLKPGTSRPTTSLAVIPALPPVRVA